MIQFNLFAMIAYKLSTHVKITAPVRVTALTAPQSILRQVE